MIELTNADRAEIDRVHDEWRESWSREPVGESLAILDEMLARHFLAAGIERAAKHAEDHMACRIWTANEAGIAGMVRREIISAIRNLLKPS